MTELEADNFIAKSPGRVIQKVQSFSRPDEWHIVWKRKDGNYDCSCEFKQIHRNLKCDHQRYVQHLKLKYKHRMKHVHTE